MKEQALAKTTSPHGKAARYHPCDQLLGFLRTSNKTPIWAVRTPVCLRQLAHRIAFIAFSHPLTWPGCRVHNSHCFGRASRCQHFALFKRLSFCLPRLIARRNPSAPQVCCKRDFARWNQARSGISAP